MYEKHVQGKIEGQNLVSLLTQGIWLPRVPAPRFWRQWLLPPSWVVGGSACPSWGTCTWSSWAWGPCEAGWSPWPRNVCSPSWLRPWRQPWSWPRTWNIFFKNILIFVHKSKNVIKKVCHLLVFALSKLTRGLLMPLFMLLIINKIIFFIFLFFHLAPTTWD